jgi:hypothetical protein
VAESVEAEALEAKYVEDRVVVATLALPADAVVESEDPELFFFHAPGQVTGQHALELGDVGGAADVHGLPAATANEVLSARKYSPAI